MRRRPMRVYEVKYPAGPDDKPVLMGNLKQLHAEGSTIDAQRASAKKKLEDMGFTIRSLANTVEGDILIYVFPKQNPARAARTVHESHWNPAQK